MPIKQEVAETFTGHWQVGLFTTPCQAPISFCAGCFCPCCCAIKQRWDILDVTGEPYVCCGGLFPCGPLGEPQDRNCAIAEACCCTGMAISANRFLIQTRFDRENTCCDDCIIWTVCLASWIVCILQCVGCDVPDEIENCVDCAIMTVDGCMLAQQQVEVKYIEKNGYQGPPSHIMGMLNPTQQQLMGQGKPSAGTGMAMAAGAVVGGAGAAAAMGGHYGGAAAPPPQVMGGGGGGFMGTLAPNGMPWYQYCQTSQARVGPNGFPAGPWGECLAWAKVYEFQNPNFSNDPAYKNEGPAGQVIEAMSAHAGGNRGAVENAADKLEEACNSAAGSGQPLPIINYTV